MLEQISHYTILKKIGAGGMGEVFLAEDQKLSRKVALKILPSDVSGERKNLNRFLQEARLAANLNHPHICTIYEIDEANEPPFLAMELVEGETLAEKIRSKSLDIHQILSVTSQIADALDEAHRREIIHRDIKASNIIINQRGQVKILDFGLAKIISEEVSEQDVTRAKTEDGMLVGTVQYMSPEQALGKQLDGRTDLWSMGVLLYEMVCGEMPFKAATQAGVFDEILHKNPTSPTELNPQIPPALENIIFKLLEKDRDFRYQTASDLLADLKRLRRSIGDVADSSESLRISTTAEANLKTQTEIPRRSVAERRTSKSFIPVILTIFLALIILSGIGFAVWKYASKTENKENPSALGNGAVMRVTNLGKVVDAVISPDGKYVVYVTDDNAKQTLWLKQIATGSALQIVAPSDNVYQGVAISPDNNWIYFDIWDRKSVGEIFRIPALGGAPQKVVHDCMPQVSVSPDGKRLVFIRSDDRNQRFVLLTINTDGTDEREILSMPRAFAQSPVYSPDGKTIAFGRFEEGSGRFPQIVEIPAEGGETKIIWEDRENNFQPSRFAWLPDKKGLLVTLSNSREFRTQIWQIDYADGSLKQITNDLNSYGALSITSDGKNLLAIQQDLLLSVWVMPADEPSEAKRITEGKTEGVGISWTPDDRIVYASNVSGNAEIWIMDKDGSDKKQLTSGSTPKLSPCVTNDGKYIFYRLVGNERGGAARIEIDGKNAKELENKWNVTCSANAPLIFYFEETGKETASFIKDSPELDSPEKISGKNFPEFIRNQTLSPDGKQVAYIYWDQEKREQRGEIGTIDGITKKSFSLPTSAVQKYGEGEYIFRFTPDGKNLTFVNDENGFSNLWLLPLNGGKTKRITDFKDNFIFSFAWSNDGKNLAVSRGTLTSDAVLFTQK